MSNQIPTSQPPDRQHQLYYFIGLGIGLIPLALALVGFGLTSSSPASSPSGVLLLYSAIILYCAEFVAWIVLLTMRRTRFLGYGLLTMWLVAPVVFFIACIVVTSRPRSSP
ncbi:MAG: hypothetical protein NVSMB49_22820 [Ktedonobacteraceae bacterium]